MSIVTDVDDRVFRSLTTADQDQSLG
jgi:hypothetical protein